MTLPVHFLASWVVANCGGSCRRDRAIITLAGLSPDMDGFGWGVDWIGERFGYSWDVYGRFHHVLFHNVLFAAAVVVAAFLLGVKRRITALLAFIAFHLHLLMDVLGSRGPDGDQWEIPYLLPFSDVWQWTWSGQWELDAWQNIAIGITLFLVTLYLARRRGFSPFEIISKRADAAFVKMLRGTKKR